jgi:DHA2 family methylenomycin A resistance protein-like MFS transporter
LLVERFGWPAIFAINVPVCLAAAVVAALTVPPDRATGRRGLDIPGQVFITVALAAATWACIEAGRVAPAVAIAVGVVAGAGFAGFALVGAVTPM